MAVLTSDQRSTLEKAVVQARKVAETGAANALRAFAVDHHEPYSHMDTDQRALRNQLRGKARLLGDHTTPNGGHTIDKLAYELAYEYWHQMLFAQFLAANHLLIHPEHEIAVTLDECEELAREEGHEDKWTAAAAYASQMLPAIFRPDDPLMRIKFATEDRVKLEQILEKLEESIFQADDSLGWVYQYWQSEAKETINKSEDKIDGERLPAVTQLFTEPYMVRFLIDNTLGAWWTARNPGVAPPVEFKYLRMISPSGPSAEAVAKVEGGRGEAASAAGPFKGWPDQLADLTMLDPCMGSGHFIAEVFKVMAALRMQAERLSEAEACDRVIAQNIHGLELDPRCTQIAAFNLALTAWKFCGRYRPLPEMNLACCGVAPKGKKEDWVRLANAEADPAKRARLRGGLERMYDLFQQAPELGSLIDPTGIQRDVFTSDFAELQPFLEAALATEKEADENHDRGVIAAGIAKAGKLLAKRYVWQITNVPYLSRGKQDATLYDFCERHYPKSKNDLATVFLEKMLKSNVTGGTSCSVIPQNWLFLTSYKGFRKELLQTCTWDVVARLGAGAFSQITGEVVKAILLSISKQKAEETHAFMGLDVSECGSAGEKDLGLVDSELKMQMQINQLGNPDARITLEELSEIDLLSEYALSLQGIASGDYPRFGRYFWELSGIDGLKWIFQQSTVKETTYYGGREYVLFWEEGNGDLAISPSARIQGLQGWDKVGVAISQMGSVPATIYKGGAFDNNTSAVVLENADHLPAIWCFCSSPQFNEEVRKIDQKLNVTNATLVKVPFDLEHWQKVAQEKYPNGLPEPYSDDPTQWLFHGHPRHTDFPLQVTIARLLGYRWPAEYDREMELAREAREKIAAIRALDLPADEDGIVCIPAVNGEPAGAERVREYILKIWGDAYDGRTIAELLKKEGSKKTDLEAYLREDFFQDHCKLFKNRPFIWHIWDGRKDGFSALVNYHALDKAALEKLIYTYLGDWINQCKLKLQNNVSGADGLLSAANALKEKLQLILAGEPPYDLFIRWKPLPEQPIGWEPDINDGVRLNVYPFVQADVLRKKFNVKWDKDRGKNPSGSPWGPERWNRYEDLAEEWKLRDEQGKVILHLTNAVKRGARIKKNT